jgi:Uncharacterized protein conserved in bacteria (DUF2325)
MQGFCSFDQLEQAFQAKLNKRQQQWQSEQAQQQAEADLRQRLKGFCRRLEQLQAAYEQNDLLDDDYAVLKTRLRQYRYQLNAELGTLTARLLELRRSADALPEPAEPATGLDLVEQLIEDRRQEQDQEEQELNLNRQQREDRQRQRQGQKARLMQIIDEQDNFFEASLLAIDVYHAMPDLKALGYLETVVEALLAKINQCSQTTKKIMLVGTAQQKLSQMYRKALEFQNGGSLFAPTKSGPAKKPARAKSADRPTTPDPYIDLKGKVVIFGGHAATKKQVKQNLPKVDLVWCTLDDGERAAKQAAEQIATADLVILLTDDTKHKTTNIAETAAKRVGKKPIRCHKEGQRSLISYIALHLKFRT